MDKIIVTVFEDEWAAYEGWRALQDLDRDGSIVVYEMAVMTKDADGSVAVKQASDQGPLGTVLGLATGSLIGLLGGPVGVAIGAGAGMMGGSLFDLAHVGFDADFLDEVAASLERGRTALVAEVDEDWTTPVTARMAALNGKVFRQTPQAVVEAQIEQDAAALEAELTQAEADLKQAEAELAQATAEAKAQVQARVAADKAKLQAARERAAAQIQAQQQEADAKVQALQAQAKTAQAERKAKLEARAAEIRAEYDRRIAKLQQASELRREAGAMTREALKP